MSIDDILSIWYDKLDTNEKMYVSWNIRKILEVKKIPKTPYTHIDTALKNERMRMGKDKYRTFNKDLISTIIKGIHEPSHKMLDDLNNP